MPKGTRSVFLLTLAFNNTAAKLLQLQGGIAQKKLHKNSKTKAKIDYIQATLQFFITLLKQLKKEQKA